MKNLAQGFNTAAQDSNPGSLSRESGALPLSHCALSTGNYPQWVVLAVGNPSVSLVFVARSQWQF